MIRKCFKAFPWAAAFLGGPKRSSTSAHRPLNRHENHANWLQSTSGAVLFLGIDLAVPALDFDLAVPALDMTPLAWATRKRTRQGSRLRATCIVHPRLVIQRPMVRQCAVALANHDVQQNRILHHNTRAEGVIQNFPWRAEWNIIPQDIAAELTCMKKTMVPKGSPCAFWG